MTIEGETGFHFRRVGADALRLAMTEPRAALGRAGGGATTALVEDWRARLARRYPPAAGAPVAAPGPASTT